MRDRRLERITGSVMHESVRDGTASEHRAVVLQTDLGERLILQRIGGHPFDDAATRRLAGHRVTVEGYRLGDIMRYTTVRTEGDADHDAARDPA